MTFCRWLSLGRYVCFQHLHIFSSSFRNPTVSPHSFNDWDRCVYFLTAVSRPNVYLLSFCFLHRHLLFVPSTLATAGSDILPTQPGREKEETWHCCLSWQSSVPEINCMKGMMMIMDFINETSTLYSRASMRYWQGYVDAFVHDCNMNRIIKR